MILRPTLSVLLLACAALGCVGCESEPVSGSVPTGETSISDVITEPEQKNDETTGADSDRGNDRTDLMKDQPDRDAPTAYNPLTEEEQYIILEKGTERPGTGALLNNKAAGTYICRQCNAPLYTSDQKFESHCGWPSFDDEIEGAVLRRPEPSPLDSRTEIVCNNCGGHLGHVFLGEGFTDKNTRHCVNSVSMRFVPEGEELPAKIVLDR